MTKNCILALEENPEDVYLETTTVLLKLIDNVIKDPSNPKYRNIRLGNPVVTSKLLPAGEDSLVLPDSAPIVNLKKIRDEISARRSIYKTHASGSQNPTDKMSKKESSSSSIKKSNSVPHRQHLQSQQLQLTMEKPKKPFLQRIGYNFQRVLRYEDKDLQAKALKLIPLAELEVAAQKNMRMLQMAIKKGETKEEEVNIEEFVLLELMSWFKNSFFSWVNTPECSFCKGTTKFAGHSTASLDGEAERIEVYTCNACNEQTHFPRYNNPEKLLETRKGRCGEWANCFTLLCRAFGWDARYIADETDHVWTEVYSSTRKRWIHYDPCENVCDSPLMYEAGWKKKLSYVMAYSKDEVQDVTWRYTCKQQEVMNRRTECMEEELISIMVKLRNERQKNMSEVKRNYLNSRLIAELIEFLTPHQLTEEEKKGRSSGSLVWRLARGETQGEALVPYVWKPTQAEIAAGKMHIKYSASKNKYFREVGMEEHQSWDRGVYEAKSVCRKEEEDWKMVYIARTEGSEEGSVSWKFDLTGTGVVVDIVQLSFFSKLYKTGQVNLKMCGPETCVLVPLKETMFETDAFRGNTHLEVTAKLKGGSGDNAWQQAQLFRQELTNYTDYPFEIIIKLKKV
ncbi:hypothetical protein L9F63_007121 [Diploptera punctata]|uniref:Peptide-N(4)-(N-acetyl-beta-glucosaminyl)asparagine amidase n=1 Tax=Diploptera punctata TaxID=6984 RepID=A0AAD7Z8S7_DIPPU|nr:hypothetical protein L9F63_007121 [Diploptera punctata]